MSNLQSVYNKILLMLHELEEKNSFLNQIRQPKLSDKELLALSLAAETLGIDSEHFLLKQLPESAMVLSCKLAKTSLVVQKSNINTTLKICF